MKPTVALFVLVCGMAAAAPEPPRHGSPGTITVAAYGATRTVVERWVAAFRAHHPDERILLTFVGSDVAMAQLSSGTCDVAIIGREVTAFEAKAFEWVFQYPPGQVELLTGACDQPGKSPALGAFVAENSSVRSLSYAQLRGLLVANKSEAASDARSRLAAADDVGHIYLPDTESGTGRFLRAAVLRDSRSLNWDRISEFNDSPDKGRFESDASAKILAALSRDRTGLAIAGNMRKLPPGVRRIALIADNGAEIQATAATVSSRAYPLVRPVRAYFHRPKQGQVDRITHDWLEFIVSAEGQAMVEVADDYFALPPDVADAQRAVIAALPTARVADGLDTVEQVRAAQARVVAQYPAYVPTQRVDGVIRLWGHGHVTLRWLDRLTNAWATEFRKFQPGVSFDFELHGTSSAVPALYYGDADIALLGEELLPDAYAAFTKVKHYAPTSIDVMTGSVDVRNFDYAQMFFVHRDNPLARISLPELAAIFGAADGGRRQPLRTWGDLGLAREWSDKPIELYGWRTDDSFGFYLQNALLGGGHHWNTALHEYVHIYRSDGSIFDHGEQILNALAHDRYGIAVSNIRYAGPDVKPLAIATRPGEPAFAATTENLIARRYPLSRLLPAIVDWPPGGSLEPKVREFLRFVLSREGQAAVVSDGRYLPLAAEVATRERATLN